MKVFFKDSKYPQGYLPKIAKNLAMGNQSKVDYYEKRQLEQYGDVTKAHIEFVQLRRTRTLQAMDAKDRTYFDSYIDALDAAFNVTTYLNEYVVDDEQWDEYAMGSDAPSVGEYHNFSVGLYRKGRQRKQCLHVSIYGMEGGKYELNFYVN
jgi:hypothetical protein